MNESRDGGDRLVRVAGGMVRASYYCEDHVLDLKSRWVCPICGKRIQRKVEGYTLRGFPE